MGSGSKSRVRVAKVGFGYQKVGDFPGFQVYGYPNPSLNTGHSIMVDICSDNPSRHPRISGGGLNDTYIFHQLHFHWYVCIV